MVMMAPIAYRLDSVVEFHEEIRKLDLKDSDIASLRCPNDGCSAQYGVLFPYGLTVTQKTVHLDLLLIHIERGCPEHLEKLQVR